MSTLAISGALTFVGAACLSWFATIAVRRWAVAHEFVDRPGGHKGHASPTPLGGGVAVFVAICLPLVTVAILLMIPGIEGWLPDEIAVHVEGARAKLPQLGAILAGLVTVFVVGIVDDRRGLSSGLRLGIQLLVGVLLWLAGVRITAFIDIPGASVVLTALWLAAITNAFNLLDNTDGLSSGLAVITAFVLAVSLASPTPQYFVIALLVCTAGAAAGFWLHNRPPATIFMGDAGSTTLGYMIAVASILGTFYGEGGRTRAHAVAVPLLVLAIPLYDTASVVILRCRRGVSPLVGDRNHFSHRLRRLGLSTWATLGTIYLATLATGLGALVVDRATGTGATILLIQGGLILGIIAILEAAAHRVPPAAAGSTTEDDEISS